MTSATDDAIRAAIGKAIDAFPGKLHSEKIDAVLAAVTGPLVARERERCAVVIDGVYLRLIAGDVQCPCGQGRTPTQAYRTAVDACAAAIRGTAP